MRHLIDAPPHLHMAGARKKAARVPVVRALFGGRGMLPGAVRHHAGSGAGVDCCAGGWHSDAHGQAGA
jgi:hypothetical protein